MNKSNYKEWSVNFNGKTIKVSNWWNWKMKGSADLYLDDEHLDKNTDMMANPKKAIWINDSDEIKSIEVFKVLLKLKYQLWLMETLVDKLSSIDRFANMVFSSIIVHDLYDPISRLVV